MRMGPIMQELQTDGIIWLKNDGKTLSTGSEWLMGCTAQFLPVQGNCSDLHSCISHTNPIRILLLAAGPLEAQLVPTEALQTRVSFCTTRPVGSQVGSPRNRWHNALQDGQLYRDLKGRQSPHSHYTGTAAILLVTEKCKVRCRLPNRKK